MTQRTGKVKFYIPDRGFGFVIDGKDEYFFHVSNCNYEPKADDSISFTVKDTKKGPNAIDITKA